MNVLPAAAAPSQDTHNANDASDATGPGTPEAIAEALGRVRRQQLQLAQREKQLMQALGQATAARLGRLLGEGGLAAPELEGLMRRAAGLGGGAVPGSPAGAGRAAASATVATPRLRKAAIRFRHPDQPGLVWSGRGKTPLWVKALQAQGRIEQARVAQRP
jgi:hypothetical protein